MNQELFSFILFTLFPIVFLIIFPVFFVVFISRIFVEKSIHFKTFIPFIALVMGFTIIICMVWEIYVYDLIYHEWDTIFVPRFNLITQEVPVVNTPGIDYSGTWIDKDWTVNKLNMLAFFMRLTIYLPALFIAILLEKRKGNNQAMKQFIQTLILAIVILLALTVIVPVGFQWLFQQQAVPVFVD